MSVVIALSELTVDLTIQPRKVPLNPEHADEIAAAVRAGQGMPPVRVFRTPDGRHVLTRGFHRCEGYKRAGKTHIPAEIREGTYEDATLDAAASAPEHQTLKFGSEDKRNAVTMVLRIRPEWTDRRISDHTGVSDKTVADVRRELVSGAEIPHLTARQGKDGKAYTVQPTKPKQAKPGATKAKPIAEEEGVSLGQVQRDLEAGTSGVSGDTPEPAKVTGRDGKIYPVAPKPIDYPPTVEDAPAEPDDVEPVYGEAWDPEDGNDTEFDFGANAPAGPVDEPVPEAEPPPAGSPRKKLPSHFKPGNNADPDHPFANILAALTHTTGLITRALNTPEGEKLRAYLSPLAAVPIPIKHVDFSSDVIKGDEYVAGKCRFVGHRALRHLVHLAGLPGRVKAPDAVLDAYRKTALTGDDQ